MKEIIKINNFHPFCNISLLLIKINVSSIKHYLFFPRFYLIILLLLFLLQTNAGDAGSSNSSSKKSSPILTHFSPRKSKDRIVHNLSGSQPKKDRTSDAKMTAVSMNRTEIPLKCVPGGDAIRSYPTAGDKSRYEMKSVIMPLRNTVNSTNTSTSGSAIARGTVEQTTTNRQPINASGHSYSSDSDVVPNTTTTPSATAMRRLYFKSAKLSKTTQNSITTVHQQQHVPKVIKMIEIIQNFFFKLNLKLITNLSTK